MTVETGSAERGADDAHDLATLRSWIEAHAGRDPDRTAIRTREGTLGWGELHARALVLAALFRTLGLQRGDVIAAQLPNSVEFALAYLAAGFVGAVFQTIHMPYRSVEIGSLLRHSRAKAVLCLDLLKDVAPAELILALRPDLPDLAHIVVVGSKAPAGTHAFPAGDTRAPEPVASVPEEDAPDARDRFLLLYTSGTTSAPKAVPIPYRRFLPNAALSAVELGIDAGSVLLSAAPFTHLYGLFSLNLAFASGAATAILPAYTPGGLAEALDTLRPTGLFVAPAHMAACLEAGLLTPERLGTLRFVLISGSACAPELARALQDRMPDGAVLQLWGMSELQVGSFTRPGDDERLRLASAGRASPGTQLRVTREDEPLAPGLEGELQVRGRSVFDGYLDHAGASAGAFTPDGWFRTGDLARMDAAGYIELTGRTKDVINRGGIKFNPADTEALIARHPAVEICAIVPMPDPVLGERACCFVVRRPVPGPLALDDLCEWLASHGIAKITWPERLVIIDEMPMTPTRKIVKAELARRARGEVPRAG